MSPEQKKNRTYLCWSATDARKNTDVIAFYLKRTVGDQSPAEVEAACNGLAEVIYKLTDRVSELERITNPPRQSTTTPVKK